MCGIIGYIGPREAAPILLDGLRRLEYRGYDSAGIVTAVGGALRWAKCPGKLASLETLLRRRPLAGRIGLGHTRWATHGPPTHANAHPHLSCDLRIALVHNGIIENADALRERLARAGHTFRSQTDTEVLAHLLEDADRGDPVEAVRRAVRQVEGSYALGVLFQDHPDRLVAVRRGSPLVLGAAGGEAVMASDVLPILSLTRSVIYLNDGEVAVLRPDGIEMRNGAGRPARRRPVRVAWGASTVEKEGHPHFMLKEIHEQPRALAQFLAGRLEGAPGDVRWEEAAGLRGALERAERVVLTACGTASHAGIVGKYALEDLARVPTEVTLASEFRYGNPAIGRRTVVVAISQSGETADTLAAVGLARERGAKVLAVTNVAGSSLTRAADATLFLRAGPEIGVAATKTYTTQVAALLWLALGVGRLRGTLEAGRARSVARSLRHLPQAVEGALRLGRAARACAARTRAARSFMYIGRRYNLATAYEGALKLKEISYLHAEGYGAGEMKHGPLALIDPGYPVVAIAFPGPVYDKMLSNIEEVRARRGRVIAVGVEGDARLRALADILLPVPSVDEVVSPVVAVVPLQLLAYHVARLRGCDVDQPRNLAKSVTVE